MAGEEYAGFIGLLAIALTGLLVFLFLSIIFHVRRSKRYRQEVADMFVAAKTKQLAKKEDLDLIEEYESFKKWCKKERLSYSNYGLDDYIEQDLIEKIEEPVKKK